MKDLNKPPAQGLPDRRDRPDLVTQLEDLLHTVWLAEAEWELDDRIELATRLAVEPRR